MKSKTKGELNIIDDELKQEFEMLPEDFWDFKNEDTKELTHSIHNYPAVMVYPISRYIINTVKKYQNIDSLLDPFMGSGTVLLEALLSGFTKIYGNDLNPLAYKISKAKTTIIRNSLYETYETFNDDLSKDYKKYAYVLEKVSEYVEKRGYDITAKVNDKDNWGAKASEILNHYLEENNSDLIIPEIKNLGFWFVPTCIIELQIIKNRIDKIADEDIRDYFMLAFSETTRLVSNRRNGEFKMYRMKPEKVKDYSPDVKNEYIRILLANIEKMLQLSERIEKDKSDIKLLFEDAKELTGIPDDSVDLVITSPPYGDSKTTVAYGQFSRVSLQWCDYEKLSYQEIIDIDKRLMGGNQYKKGFDYDLCSDTLKTAIKQILKDENNIERAGDVYSFYKDLESIVKTVTKKCKKNSYQFWVVGNRTVKGVLLPTDEILVEMGEKAGLKHITTLGRNIVNKVMPSKNSPTNETGKTINTMNKELIVTFRKE